MLTLNLKGVHRLIEASAEFIVAKDMQRGLEKAKEAGKGNTRACNLTVLVIIDCRLT